MIFSSVQSRLHYLEDYYKHQWTQSGLQDQLIQLKYDYPSLLTTILFFNIHTGKN